MSDKILNVRLRHAVRLESEWVSADPVLLKGELAFSSDKGLFKQGDGTSKWSELSYNEASSLYGLEASIKELNYIQGATGNIQTQLNDNKAAISKALSDAKSYTDTEIAELINGAPTTLDTLKEIADAMAENDDVVKALDEAIANKANKSELGYLEKYKMWDTSWTSVKDAPLGIYYIPTASITAVTDVPSLAIKNAWLFKLKRTDENFYLLHMPSGNSSKGYTWIGNEYGTSNGVVWDRMAKETDLAGYVKNTGNGGINGNWSVYANDATVRQINLQNSLRRIYHEINPTGFYSFYDATNDKPIIRSTEDGTNTFYGTATGNATVADITSAIAKINLGVLNILESDLDTLAKDYNVPGSTTYIATINPKTSADGKYEFGGYQFSIIGMEYGSHKYGYQIGLRGTMIKMRNLNNGVWDSSWRTLATTLDLTTALTGYLPKTGGEIRGQLFYPLTLNNEAQAHSMVAYKAKGVFLGCLGFSEENVAQMWTSEGGQRTLLHSGNYSNYALPLTGGYTTGETGIGESDQEKHYTFGYKNKNNYLGHQLLSYGDFRLVDLTTMDKIYDSVRGSSGRVNTFYGTATGNLPLTGGTITGNLTVGSNGDSDLRVMAVKNSVKNVSNYVNASGYFYLYDHTNDQPIIRSTPLGTNTFYGTATGNLSSTANSYVETQDSTAIIGAKATTGTIELRVGGTGNRGVYAPEFAKWLIVADSNGVVTVNGLATENLALNDYNSVTKNGAVVKELNINGKRILDAGNYSDYALPKTGGSLNGNLSVRTDNADVRAIFLINSKRNVYQVIDENGTYSLYDATNSKLLISSNVSGSNTFYGDLSGSAKQLDGQAASMYYSLSKATALAEGTDLNTVKTFGNYVFPTATAKTLINAPFTDFGGVLKVERTANDTTNYVRQTAFYGKGGTYVRTYYSGTWTAWEKMATTADVSTASGSFLPLTNDSVPTVSTKNNTVVALSGISGGAYTWIDFKNGTTYIGSLGFSKDGKPHVLVGGSAEEVLHEGNYKNYAVAKESTSQQMISVKQWKPFAINNSSTANVYMEFRNKNGVAGFLGFSHENEPAMYTADESTHYKLLHAGNYTNYMGDYVKKDGSTEQASIGKGGILPYASDCSQYFSSGTGRVRITLPKADSKNCMLCFDVTLHRGSGGRAVYTIGFRHKSGDTSISGGSAYSVGTESYAKFPVVIGTTGTNIVVTIGNDNSDFKDYNIVVSNIRGATYETYRQGWSIGITSDNSDISALATYSTPWIGNNFATTTALTGYLPLNGGGTVVAPSTSNTAMYVKGSATNGNAWIGYYDLKSNILGRIGFHGVDNLAYLASDGTTVRPILHSGNYYSYALPLTGGTLTGRLNVTRTAATKTSPQDQDIVINCTLPSGTTLAENNAPGIGFHVGGTTWASLIYDNYGFKFISNDFSSYMKVYASKFIGALQGNADSASVLSISRVSTSANTPNTLPGINKFQVKEFANNCSNLPKAAYYHVLTTEGPDAAYASQLALGMTDNNVYYRNYQSNKWADWKQLAFTDSNITGNAATATSATTASKLKGVASYANIPTTPGDGLVSYSYNVNNGTTGLFNSSSNANSILTLSRHAGNHDSQLGFSSDGNIYYRYFNGVAINTTTAWRTILDSSNIGSYAITLSGKAASIGKDAYIAYPGGGQFYTQTTKFTGLLKITLPVSWTNTMMKFKVSIFNYKSGTSVDYIISGYNYATDKKWSNTEACCVSKWGGKLSNLPVSFGHDGTYCAITIGATDTVWDYPQVTISDVTVGYSNTTYNTWNDGWSISFITSTLSTVSGTMSNTNIGYSVNYANSAGTATNANYLSYASGNEINFKNGTNVTEVYFNYRNADTNTGKDNIAITKYHFCNKNASTSGVTLVASEFSGNAATATTAASATKAGYLTVNSTFDPTDAATDSYKLKAYDSYSISGTPTTYGNVLEINGINGHWKPQLWFDSGKTGSVRHRNRNYNDTTWGDWYIFLDTRNFSDYALSKSGGIMTGSIQYKTTNFTSTPLQVYDDGTNYGHTLRIGSGGTTIVGAGESSGSMYSSLTSNPENLYLTADQDIHFYTYCDTFANKKGMIYSTSGNLYPITNNTGTLGTSSYRWANIYATNINAGTTTTDYVYVKASNSNGSIGLYSATNRGLYDFTSDKWIVYTEAASGNMHFNGNAVSATKDGGGNVITSTYLRLTGGTISASEECPLKLNTTVTHSYIHYMCKGTAKAASGYYNGLAYIANAVSLGRIGVDDSGTPQYWTHWNGKTKYNLIHAGNYSSYALPLTGGTIVGAMNLASAPNTSDGYKMGKTSGASGGIHFQKNNGTDDHGNAITWSYAKTDDAHAGIYVKSSGSYGTKMYLATTNLFADGAKAALEIDQAGNITALRAKFVGDLSGNAATATTATTASKVAKALSINGKTYNGSSAITVGTMGVAYGGTGATSFTSNYVLLGNGTGAIKTANIHLNYTDGTTSANGYEELVIGNSTATGTAGNRFGRLAVYSKSSAGIYLTAEDTTSWSYTSILPKANGTLLNSGNYSSYALPLSGGTLTGYLTLTDGYAIKNSSDNGLLGYGTAITPGTYVGTSNNVTIVRSSTNTNLYHRVGSNDYTILDANNYSSYALPLTGGTMKGDIKFGTSGFRTVLDNSYGNITSQVNTTGGWARGWHMYDVGTSSTIATMIGVYGNAATINHFYIGGTYTAPWLKVTPSGEVTATKFTGALSGNATSATTATTASKLSNTSAIGSSLKPVYFSASGVPVECSYTLNASVSGYSGSLASGGWKTLGGTTSGSKIYVAYNSNPAAWNSNTYSSSIVFGASDTKGLLDCGHNTPIVTFGAGSVGNSTDDAPKWYFKLQGTSGKTYTMPSESGTLALSNHNHNSSYYNAGTSRTANTVLAAPNGSAGGATFRKLVVADLPTGTTSSTVALGNHTHSYLPLSGGTLTNTLTARGIVPSSNYSYNIGTASAIYKEMFSRTFSSYTSGGYCGASMCAQTEGTTSTEGKAFVKIGNTTAKGTAGNFTGYLMIYGSSAYANTIYANTNLTANTTIYLPASGGTLALEGHTHSGYLAKSGGEMTGRIGALRGQYNATAANRYGTSALEIRENDLVTNTKYDDAYAPAIGFHWGGITAGQLILQSSGFFTFKNQADQYAPFQCGNQIVNGTLTVAAGTDYTTNKVRNIVFTTTDPGVGTATTHANGSIICVYE